MTPTTKKYLNALEKDLCALESDIGKLFTQFEKKHGVEVNHVETERSLEIENSGFRVNATVSLSVLNYRP